MFWKQRKASKRTALNKWTLPLEINDYLDEGTLRVDYTTVKVVKVWQDTPTSSSRLGSKGERLIAATTWTKKSDYIIFDLFGGHPRVFNFELAETVLFLDFRKWFTSVWEILKMSEMMMSWIVLRNQVQVIGWSPPLPPFPRQEKKSNIWQCFCVTVPSNVVSLSTTLSCFPV